MLYQNCITIEGDKLPLLFASVALAFPGQLGRWETQEEEQAVKEYILPNGLKVNSTIAQKWLDYKNSL